jgi:hypothetical protein
MCVFFPDLGVAVGFVLDFCFMISVEFRIVKKILSSVSKIRNDENRISQTLDRGRC